jgi:hypothetical protein
MVSGRGRTETSIEKRKIPLYERGKKRKFIFLSLQAKRRNLVFKIKDEIASFCPTAGGSQ